MPAEFQ